MTMVAQARGTARHKKPATAISQPKGLERNLRNALICFSGYHEPSERRLLSPVAREPKRVPTDRTAGRVYRPDFSC